MTYTGPRYLIFRVLLRDFGIEEVIVDKEKYPAHRWHWDQDTQCLTFNFVPGTLRTMFPIANVLRLELEMTDKEVPF